MIFAFLIDTGVCMNQCTYNRLSLLDCAKSVVEHFMKQRRRDPSSRNDRYFLLTSQADTHKSVRIGWDKCMNLNLFMEELKNLTAFDLSDLGSLFKNGFELLNTYRMQSGIETYAQGRNPWFVDLTTYILLTDGYISISSSQGLQNDIVITPSSQPGAEFTREPFRWDQRLFCIILGLASARQSVSSEDSLTRCPMAIRRIAEITGGTAYVSTTLRGAMQCIDQILAKCQRAGAVVSFQEHASESHDAPIVRGMLFLRPNIKEYFWPIPEEYWVDRSVTTLPSRSAQPTLLFRRQSESSMEAATTQMALEVLSFPVDVYTLEVSPNPAPPRGARWHVYVSGSKGDKGIGCPCGFLRVASSTGSNVALCLLPYNYVILFSLLTEAARMHEQTGHTGTWVFNVKVMSSQWKQRFSDYFQSCPPYYFASLRKVLKQYNLHNLVPESQEGGRSYQICNHLKRLRDTSKVETDKARMQASSEGKKTIGWKSLGQVCKSNKIDLLSIHTEQRALLFNWHNHTVDLSGFRDSLTWKGQFARLTPTERALSEDKNHAIPIGDMGSYQELLVKKEAPRDPLNEPEPDEDTPAGLRRRQLQVHFGNPYKKTAAKSNSDDNEAEDEAAILQGQSPKGKRKRRSGRGRGRKSKRDNFESPLRSALPPSPSSSIMGSPLSRSPTNPSSPSTSPRDSSSEASSIPDTPPRDMLASPGSPIDMSGGFLSMERSFGKQFDESTYTGRVSRIVDTNMAFWNQIQILIRTKILQASDCKGLFQLLSSIQGGARVVYSYTMKSIFYAKQFKRHNLCRQLEKFKENLSDE